MPGRRSGRWLAILLGSAVVAGVQGCSQGVPGVDLSSWVRSPYVAQQRDHATAAFATWLAALRHTGLSTQVQAVQDGCGQYIAGGGGAPVTDWGVTCGREVVVSVAAPDGIDAAQAVIVRALSTAGWRAWHGTLAIPAGCGGDDLHGVHAEAPVQPDIATAALSEWRLSCGTGNQAGSVRYGPGASGCPPGPMTGWVAWSWHEHVCTPVGTISRAAARSRVLISMFAVYADVDEGTSSQTAPPAP
jgi:hypothetical protein